MHDGLVVSRTFTDLLNQHRASLVNVAAHSVSAEVLVGRRPVYRHCRHGAQLSCAYWTFVVPCSALTVHYVINCSPTESPSVFGNWTTRGYANSRIANSRTGRLADWTTRGLVISRMPPATLRAYSFRFLAIRETASCPVRELANPRVVQLPGQTWTPL